MSMESVETVVGKALLDAEFRSLLLAKPEEALRGFDLTPTEKASLMSIDSETLDALATAMDVRVGSRFFKKK